MKPGYVFFIMLALLAAVSFLSLGAGAVPMSPLRVAAAFAEGNPDMDLIVKYRLPRLVLAWLVGGSLAVSGAILQGVVRNPLASPDVIGFTKGASLAAVVVIILFPHSPLYALPVSAFAGAAAVAAALYVLTWRRGARPSTLALVGIAIGALCHAAIQYLMIRFPVDVNAALVWLSGSLWGREWTDIYGLLPWFLVLLPVSLFLAQRLNILSLGDDVSVNLGIRVAAFRYLLVGVAVALAGSSVAVAGSIGFVGLIAPHMARQFVGSRHQHVIPAAAVLGAIILTAADAAGRGLLPPAEIPAGIITSVLGAPYFLYLLREYAYAKITHMRYFLSIGRDFGRFWRKDLDVLSDSGFTAGWNQSQKIV